MLWLVAVNFHSKNTSNRTRTFAGKRQKSSRALQIAFIRVFARESVIISSIQVLFAEKCPGMNRASNIGRAIIKKLAVKFEGNEIMSVDDYDIFSCYQDLWKTKSEKRNAIRQGIISTDGCMENCIKLRINSGDKNASNAQNKAQMLTETNS